MSKERQERFEELRRQYTNTAAQLGDHIFQSEYHSNQANKLRKDLRQVAQEIASVREKLVKEQAAQEKPSEG